MLYFGRDGSSWGHRAFFGSSWGEKVITPKKNLHGKLIYSFIIFFFSLSFLVFFLLPSSLLFLSSSFFPMLPEHADTWRWRNRE
jgi:hypothetical protein